MKFILIFFISTFSFASEVFCSNQDICDFINQIHLKNKIENLKVVFTNDLEKLKTVNFYISAPHYLDPKMTKIVEAREDQSKKGFRMYIPSNLAKLYKITSANPVEELSHVWLYPDIQCYVENEYLKSLSFFDLKIQPQDCSEASKQVIQLKKYLHQLSPALIVTNLLVLKPLLSQKSVTIDQAFIPGNFKTVINFTSMKFKSNYQFDLNSVSKFELFNNIFKQVEAWTQNVR